MAIKIGLIGAGTVGGGCIDIINNHKEDFKRHYGIDIELARVCSLVKAEAEQHGVGDLWTDNFNEVIDDPEIDIVIELIGGTTFARTVVVNSLNAGKRVVTANKALMATYGKEIMALADEKQLELAFEASVGGGIPIIGPLKHSLISNEIQSVMGIVNGTTNYMITRMVEAGMTYDDALKEAQALGYAEANPSADVDGYDAAAKIAILASIAFNTRISIDDVYTEGISMLDAVDMEVADELDYALKLLAVAHRTDKGIDVRVHPTMIPKKHQLATVNGVDNAIFVVGDAVGETMFYGPGAGAGPAASAVMGDVLEVARHLQMGINPIVGCTCTDQIPVLPMGELETKYCIRFSVADRPGVLAAMSGVFAKYNVSVRSVVQRGESEGEEVTLVYVTHTAKESDIQAVLADISLLDDVLRAEPTTIRVEG